LKENVSSDYPIALPEPAFVKRRKPIIKLKLWRQEKRETTQG
jgi:hypothetical protein